MEVMQQLPAFLNIAVRAEYVHGTMTPASG
jgi:hypothetical protein